MNPIRQGRCEFADYDGNKHKMVWTVGVDDAGKLDPKKMIKKTNIYILKILIDDELCASFEEGRWKRRPPLFGVAKDAYKVVRTLYS